jgi:hypothetical protein
MLLQDLQASGIGVSITALNQINGKFQYGGVSHGCSAKLQSFPGPRAPALGSYGSLFCGNCTNSPAEVLDHVKINVGHCQAKNYATALFTRAAASLSTIADWTFKPLCSISFLASSALVP